MSTRRDEGRDRPGDALDGYHRPGPVPRDEMWAGIAARLADVDGLGAAEGHDVRDDDPRNDDARNDDAPWGGDDLARARARKRRGGAGRPLAGWAVAAAAVLALGVGIGRMTAPTAPGGSAGPMGSASASSSRPDGARGPSALTLATREHFGRTESLLTLVRADARDGTVDPAVAGWADGLLSQTRLILDRDGISPETRELLLDLELVLAQVVNAARAGAGVDEQAGTETSLTVQALEDGQILSRLQLAMPDGLSGT